MLFIDMSCSNTYDILQIFICSQVNQSTTSRKGNVGASVNKSKYGGTGTVYASSRSRTNVLSSASKKSLGPGVGDKSVPAKPPVQVCYSKNARGVVTFLHVLRCIV